MAVVTGGKHRFFACDNCGSTDDFVEVNRSINQSRISYIMFDTGEIGWGGDTEYGDPNEHLRYQCRCGHQFDESAFGVKQVEKQVVEALAELDKVWEDV